jgi:hypothetical protein
LVVVEGNSEGGDEDFGFFQTDGVPGARVFVDDLEISPDDSGLALIEAHAPIETITCEAPGWVMQGLKGFEPNGHGLGFVLMARE